MLCWCGLSVRLYQIMSTLPTFNNKMSGLGAEEKKQALMTRPTLCLICVVIAMIIAVVLYSVLPPTFNNNDKEGNVSPVAPSEGGGEATRSDPLLVSTRSGLVRGAYSEQVRVFRGVPYAGAPTGELRWSQPRDPDPWSPDVFDATKPRPGCPQDCSSNPLFCSNKTSEDCLFLDIYVPGVVSDLVPVMVYYHGGRFQDATITLPIFDSTWLVQRAQVIMVLVEYRIGALGFLLTGEGVGHATGNYWIQDQIQALSWVKANIRSFGGDPDKVTLVGQSSGAQSVLIHLVSDAARHFRSVIVESPPLTLPYKSLKDARSQGRTFAQILNCVSNNSAINVTCLREKTVAEIISAQTRCAAAEISVTSKIEPWSPVVDGIFVKSNPLDALREYAQTNKQIHPIMSCYTTEEGLGFVKNVFQTPVSHLMYTLMINTILTKVPEDLDQLYPVTDKNDMREVLSQVLTDLIFRCPLRYFIKVLKSAGHREGVWLYAWDRPLDARLPGNYAVCNNRTCHNTEIPYVFQSFNRIFNSSSDKDLQLSNIIIDYYAHFMKNGNPNIDKNVTARADNGSSDVPGSSQGSQVLVDWPAAVSGEKDGVTRLQFTRDGRVETAADVTDTRCDAWDKVGYSVLGRRK